MATNGSMPDLFWETICHRWSWAFHVQLCATASSTSAIRRHRREEPAAMGGISHLPVRVWVDRRPCIWQCQRSSVNWICSKFWARGIIWPLQLTMSCPSTENSTTITMTISTPVEVHLIRRVPGDPGAGQQPGNNSLLHRLRRHHRPHRLRRLLCSLSLQSIWMTRSIRLKLWPIFPRYYYIICWYVICINTSLLL